MVCAVLAVVLLSTSWATPSFGQMDNFAHTVLKAKGCMNGNFVLPRGDGTADDLPGSKPWSVNWNTYGGPHPDSMAYCTSTQHLLSSLKGGVRVTYDTLLPDLEAEKPVESWFIPQSCSFRWYTSHEICNLLGRFSQIILVGDSLMRHIHQALFMLLRDDLQSGGMPLHLVEVTQYDKCSCDGQFSEHLFCRDDLKTSAHMADPRQYGICTGSSYHPFSLIMRQPEAAYSLSWDSGSCAGLMRPVFILLGAGSHHKHDPHTTINEVIEPFLSELRDAKLACPNVTFHVVFMGLGSQSRSLDLKYPHQSRELTANFNAEVSGFLKETHGMDFIDVSSLNRSAPTSDGYHFLSDVNLIKAMYVLNYMDLLAI